jgi:uncharacterized membrane protein
MQEPSSLNFAVDQAVVRILAQREHPFWRSVNAISGFA